jgi:hypothetical protein
MVLNVEKEVREEAVSMRLVQRSSNWLGGEGQVGQAVPLDCVVITTSYSSRKSWTSTCAEKMIVCVSGEDAPVDGQN